VVSIPQTAGPIPNIINSALNKMSKVIDLWKYRVFREMKSLVTTAGVTGMHKLVLNL